MIEGATSNIYSTIAYRVLITFNESDEHPA